MGHGRGRVGHGRDRVGAGWMHDEGKVEDDVGVWLGVGILVLL